ncbi:hypothetical protein [Granulicella sibirica]|nr:hypothetical protein [Granulicella sibirica]
MDAKLAMPCRNAGVPPTPVVEKVSALIEALAFDESFLASRGLSPSEYTAALPMVLEAMRGSQSASNSDRRLFLRTIFDEMVSREIISGYDIPTYGEDTIYKLHVPD